MLFEDAASSEDDSLHTNKEYEKAYFEQRRKAELARKETRAKLNAVREELASEEEEESELEDSDAELLTEGLDQDIATTLELIRKRDPAIYNTDASFYNENDGPVRKSHSQKEVTVRDMAIQDAMKATEEEAHQKTYVGDQRNAKRAFREATAVTSESDDELFEAVAGSEPVIEAPPAAPQTDHEFLEQYLTKQWWKQDPSNVPRLDRDDGHYALQDQPDTEDDEDDLDRQNAFEHDYNFRFEEAGANRIKTFPRDIDDTVRNSSSKRAEARKRKAERAALARKKEEEELNQLRNLKEKEMERQLQLIRETAGSRDLPVESVLGDLEEDFDPATFDAKMEQLFDDGFYAAKDADEEHVGSLNDAAAPEDVRSAVESYVAKKGELEDVYKLDFEDLGTDGTKHRFHYTSVTPQDYGIDITDILNADDADLKQRVSLRYLAPYRESTGAAHWKELKKQEKQRYKEFKRKSSTIAPPSTKMKKTRRGKRKK